MFPSTLGTNDMPRKVMETSCATDPLVDVILHKPSGGKLGCSITPVAALGGSGLYVKSLASGGAIDVHNRTCDSDKAILPGDCIVRVGAIALDAHAMMQALAESEELSIGVLRQARSAIPAEVPSPAVQEVSTPTSPHASRSQACSTSAMRLAPVPVAALLQSKFTSEPVKPQSSVGRASAQHHGSTPAPPPGLENFSKLSSQAFGSVPAEWLHRASRSLEMDSGEAITKTKSKGKGKVKMEITPETRLTTMMLRQLPDSFSREQLLELLNEKGFAGQYDFVYLPMNLRTQLPFPYAFINLVTPEAAEACRQVLDGYSGLADAAQVCIASWADSEQGLEANIERYRNSPVMHETVPDSCKPMLFKDGVRIAFPSPTKPLKGPPIRKPRNNGEQAQPLCPGSNQEDKNEKMNKTFSSVSTVSTASTSATTSPLPTSPMASPKTSADYREAALRVLGMRPPPGLEAEVVTLVRLSC